MTTKPIYFTQTYTIPAAAGGVNGNVPLAIAGTFLRCLASSVAGTPFLIQIDDGALGQMDQGLSAVCAPGDAFQKISLQNASGAPITVTIAWGLGQLLDSRLSVTGIVSENMTEVGGVAVPTGAGANGAGGVQRVAVANDTGLNPLPNGVQANQLGDSVFNSISSSGTIIAPASNVNGIIVRGNSMILGQSAAGTAALATGTAVPTSALSNENILAIPLGLVGLYVLGHDVFIPPGKGLYWYQSSTVNAASVSYKVL